MFFFWTQAINVILFCFFFVKPNKAYKMQKQKKTIYLIQVKKHRLVADLFFKLFTGPL